MYFRVGKTGSYFYEKGENIMEKIQFDSGMKEYRINGDGVLRFNPSDPNVYARFMEAVDKLKEMEKSLQQPVQGAEAVKLMRQADSQMKQLLGWVFGEQNDFDKLLGGVSLLAVAGNGQRVVTNLFAALEPVLEEGATACAAQQVDTAVAKAKNRRQSQC